MTPRLLRFLRRHAWSVSLGGLSTLSFLRLASELREGELGPFDDAVARSIARFRGRLDEPMLALSQIGGLAGMTVLCLGTTLLLAVMRNRKEARFMLMCGAGALVLSALLKLAFHRARPDAALLYLLETPDSFSFPSGHALGSTSVVGALLIVAWVLTRTWLSRIGATVLALLFVAGVAASRVYFGIHFPSDVLAGALAGAAWVAAVTGWFYPRLLPGEASGETP